ncbi:MAG TPA: hypothetical protein DCL65_12240 [Chryseobacterium sp.]|nr:hypothetical protein [Chryseobacterium sp.]
MAFLTPNLSENQRISVKKRLFLEVLGRDFPNFYAEKLVLGTFRVGFGGFLIPFVHFLISLVRNFCFILMKFFFIRTKIFFVLTFSGCFQYKKRKNLPKNGRF